MDAPKISRDNITWLVVGFFLGVISLGLLFLVTRQTRPAPIYITPAPPKPTAVPTETPGPITVFINGQVVEPGVIELPQGSILNDAIKASGGYTDQANADIVNLALPLSSGMHIYVPAVNERVELPVVPSVAAATESSEQKININTASVEELDRLPGIGPATAQKIIDYREANGLFEDLESLQDVSGIGPSKFQQLQELITLD